ncbi:MAG: DegT/DnrJ/EryC1/StrS family aminotransferase [Pseudorhodobacter sp.]
MSALPDLGAPPALPPEAQAAALALLENGRLHRYREAGGDGGSVARLERAFAAMLGARFAVAVNSCGSAMFLSLLGAGVGPGDPVLMNAFTLGPVPGAIAHAGARAVLVEITPDLVIDLDDLALKAASSGARHLLLSHMRGHLCDMGALMTVCDRLGIAVIEDCAHALGAAWDGRAAGRFGIAGAFSFQSGKHVNAGEGGVIVTDDADLAARAILHSGSYMLYAQNGTCPPDTVMARWRDLCPNFSLRMSALVAELALPQLPLLPARVADWNASHDRIAARLTTLPGVTLPRRDAREAYAQSSIQFRLPGRDAGGMADFIAAARERGLFVKWFGMDRAEGYTSNPSHWHYVDNAGSSGAMAVQATLCDIRLPLGLTPQDCDRIVEVLAASLTTNLAKD